MIITNYTILNDEIYELKKENKQLQQENKILKENAEHNDKVVDKYRWENQLLKEQKEELKKWLEEIVKAYEDDYKNLDEDEEGRHFAYNRILDKIKELEEGVK